MKFWRFLQDTSLKLKTIGLFCQSISICSKRRAANTFSAVDLLMEDIVLFFKVILTQNEMM